MKKHYNLDPEQIMFDAKRFLQSRYHTDPQNAKDFQLHDAVAQAVNLAIAPRWMEDEQELLTQRRACYISAEWLMGRLWHNNLFCLGVYDQMEKLLSAQGAHLSDMEDIEDAALGNGGLGRLAACFLDSLTTLKLPAMGCTIRYEYGLFRQKLVDGYQVEVPDNWLAQGNIWEIPHPEDTVEIHFGGRVEMTKEGGRMMFRQLDYTTVQAVPYDIPVIGYDSTKVNFLRTWSAKAVTQIDMLHFNRGDYAKAMEERELAEVISKILYPNDDSYQGKELRLKQQYFFSSASVQHAVKEFIETYGYNWSMFPNKVAIHINDTHPAVAIPELMRILMDDYGVDWEKAETICYRTFAYTNHTVLVEALEKWPESLFAQTLPRIYMILQEMNKRLCARLWDAFPGQWDRIGHMAILAYGQVHMANLCVSASHSVNGVSGIHTDILKKQTFHDYYLIDPNKFVSITNGITHRRWLMQCNPELSSLIDEAIGDKWRKNMDLIADLKPFADDAAFRQKFAEVKYQNKLRMADALFRHQGIEVDADSIFDAQAKRLHEYKRQLMNALRILAVYNEIDENPDKPWHPQTFIFGAKAAPGYWRAKLTIKLINAVGDLVARHPVASKYIKVVFLENYCVSQAELLMPATDVSEQISTAGKEASGTGNMKFMMNGAVTLGTMDGANCEIFDCVGKDNIYIFGLNAEQVEQGYHSYRAHEMYETNPRIRKIMEQLIDGTLSPENPRMFQEIYHGLLFGEGGAMADPYFVLKDLPDYVATHKRLLRDYDDKDVWLRKAVLNTASSAMFTSDRTIREYNDKIWHLKPLDL